MGRMKGYTLSPERIKRMQMAKERRNKGYTRHLHVVEELARKKIEELFKEWGVDLKEARFIVEGCNKDFQFIPKLQEENLAFNDAVKKGREFLELQKVKEVDILCYSEGVESKTEQTGNVVFMKKIESEYLVESYDEWGRRPGAE